MIQTHCIWVFAPQAGTCLLLNAHVREKNMNLFDSAFTPGSYHHIPLCLVHTRTRMLYAHGKAKKRHSNTAGEALQTCTPHKSTKERKEKPCSNISSQKMKCKVSLLFIVLLFLFFLLFFFLLLASGKLKNNYLAHDPQNNIHKLIL